MKKTIKVIAAELILLLLIAAAGIYLKSTGYTQVINTIDKDTLLYENSTHLDKGRYTADVYYDADSTQYFSLNSESGNIRSAGTYGVVLPANKKEIHYDFVVTESIDDFGISLQYSGIGILGINDITVHRNLGFLKQVFFTILLLFLAVDLVLVNPEFFKKNRAVILHILLFALLSSIPLFRTGLYDGDDLQFHLMRIESMYQEMKAGSFPVRMQSYWAAGYGYPVSIYYASLFLYLPALLRFCGYTVSVVFKIYVFCVNLATAGITYYSMRYLVKNKRICLFSSLLYVTAYYRLSNIYFRSALGEYSAMAFFPLVAAGFIGLVGEKDPDHADLRKPVFMLALGMTGIIQCNVLTTEMVLFVLIGCSIVLFKRFLNLRIIKAVCGSVFTALLLNLFYIVPFMDYFMNVKVDINDTVSKKISLIQASGMDLPELFAFWAPVFNVNKPPRSPGFFLMSVFLMCAVLWAAKSRLVSFRVKFLTVVSGVLLLASTNLFPWNLIVNVKLGSLLSQIQFPYRFVGIASMTLTLLFAFFAEEMSEKGLLTDVRLQGKRLFVGCNLLVLIAVFIYSVPFFTNDVMAEFYNTEDVYATPPPEYCFPNISGDMLEKIQANCLSDKGSISVVERNGSESIFACRTEEDAACFIVPIFNYRGYTVKDRNHIEYQITDDPELHRISFVLPANFDGEIMITFEWPWYWKAAECISATFALYFFVLKRNCYKFVKTIRN